MPSKRTNIRKNDTVQVIAGRDKGKQGRVLEIDARRGRLLVEHAQMVKKHVRPNPPAPDQRRHRRARRSDSSLQRDADLPQLRPGKGRQASRRRWPHEQGVPQVRQSVGKEVMAKGKKKPTEREAAVKTAPVTPRLKQKYAQEVRPALAKEFPYSSSMAVPKLAMIRLNIGLGEAIQNARLMDAAVTELAGITGQRPVVTRARKSVAAFKLRQGMAIGCAVTLRGNRMYEFLDRLISIALPRVRDFRGISTKSFDGRGNYTLGLREHLIFPEIDYAKVDKMKGMNRDDRDHGQQRSRGAVPAAVDGNALPKLD